MKVSHGDTDKHRKNMELKTSVFSVAKIKKMKKAFTPLERKDIRPSSAEALRSLEKISNGAGPSFLTGFTLIELVVTVALLGMVIFFTSLIFRVSVDAHRTSGANADIMQKLRAITDQLNADFKGFRWAPLFKIDFGFGQSEIYGQTVNVRSDGILFFANGDFQSTGQHKYKVSEEKTVIGNVAGIFYGLADNGLQQPRNKILMRRQTILTADSDWDNVDLRDAGEYSDEKGVSSLSEVAAEQISVGDWNTPDMRALISRRDLDVTNVDDLVKYMAKGVDDFSIQYLGWDDTGRTFEFNQWRPINDELRNNVNFWNDSRIVPSALKFTFKLYDSKGIIKNGKIFTHIVYLGN